MFPEQADTVDRINRVDGGTVADRPLPFAPGDVIGGGGPGETIYVDVPRAIQYRKRGYYPVSGEFEYWLTSDPEGAPPSGNPLVDITIVATYT